MPLKHKFLFLALTINVSALISCDGPAQDSPAKSVATPETESAADMPAFTGPV